MAASAEGVPDAQGHPGTQTQTQSVLTQGVTATVVEGTPMVPEWLEQHTPATPSAGEHQARALMGSLDQQLQGKTGAEQRCGARTRMRRMKT